MRRPALLLSILTLFLLSACSTFKYVPVGQYLLLHSVKLQQKNMLPSDCQLQHLSYIRFPTNVSLNLMDLNLAIYNLSGRDTSKWINRTLRKLGEEPVIVRSCQKRTFPNRRWKTC